MLGAVEVVDVVVEEVAGAEVEADVATEGAIAVDEVVAIIHTIDGKNACVCSILSFIQVRKCMIHVV